MFKKASGEASIDAVNDATMPRLYERYFPQLSALAAAVLKSGVYSEDVAQHALIALSKSAHRFRSEDEIRAFLYITVKNKCLNILRRKKNELAYQSLDREQAFYLPNIEAKIYKLQLAGVLKKAVDGLPPRYQLMLQLSWKGYSPEEIGKLLSIKRGAVDTLKSRAIARLQKLLARANIQLSVEDLLFSIILCMSMWIFSSFFGFLLSCI